MGLVLKYGGDVNKTTTEGSLIHIAIKSDASNIVRYIINLEPKFEYRTKDKEGNNVLFACSEHNDAHSFNLLINKFIEDIETNGKSYADLLNEKNKKGNSILHELTIKKNYPLVSVLESKSDVLGVDLNAKDRSGLTYNVIKVCLSAKNF